MNGNPRYYVEFDQPIKEKDENIVRKNGLKKWRNSDGTQWVVTTYVPKEIKSMILDAFKKMK